MTWLKTYQVDLLATFPPIPEASVDCVVTSPPYKRKDGYSRELMEALGLIAGHVLKPGGRCFLNFGQLREDFGRPYEARAAVEAGARGHLIAGQTIAWVKSIAIDGLQRGHYQPINSAKTLNYCWEPIFTFYREPEPALDRLSIGIPFADKSNLDRGGRGKHGDLHCAGDVWFLPHVTTGHTTKKTHGHEFPETLVEHCLKVAGLEAGAVIYEPFLGGGTTALVARRMGFNVYATEQSAAVLEAALARCNGL